MRIDAHKMSRRLRGFTLIEAMVAMVILGMAAAGVLLPFGGGARVQAEGLHQTLAAKLANDLLEEIAAQPFDQILTWNGYAEPQGHVKDVSGLDLPDPMYSAYSRDVSCAEAYVPQQIGPPFASNFRLVTVRVYYRGGLVVQVDRLISE